MSVRSADGKAAPPRSEGELIKHNTIYLKYAHEAECLIRSDVILSVPVPNGEKQAVLRAASLFLCQLKQAVSEA